MPFEFLDDIAISDVAFRVWAKTLEGLFEDASEAVLKTMCENPESIKAEVRRPLKVKDESIEMLLFQVLQEVIFFKDAEQELLRVAQLEITDTDGGYAARGEARGEKMNPLRHHLLVDVKAVTLHRFKVRPTGNGWEATVVLDI